MIQKLLLAACFCVSLLPFNAFCEADVVDDSENFALLEEQPAAFEQPVAHDDTPSYEPTERSSKSAFTRDEPALAKDDRQPELNNNPALLDKIRGLQQEVQELRGQLELQAHDLKLLQEQELSFYKDLDARLRGETAKSVASTPAVDLNMPNTTSVPITPTATTTPVTTTPIPAVILPVTQQTKANPADEQLRYLAAYELVKSKSFDEAITEMQTFVANYPHGGYSGNAHYWLGELYMVKNNYPQAIEQFNIVLQEFPSSSKAAASLLKIGYALAASGKTEEARVKLQEVINKFPDTKTAQLAATKLNSLKSR